MHLLNLFKTMIGRYDVYLKKIFKSPLKEVNLKFFILIPVLWLLHIHVAAAQDIACFTFIGDSVGCVPFTVKVRSCAQGTATVAFNFNWRVNPNPLDYITIPNNVTDTSYTYTEPGTYIVEQLRGGAIFQRRTVQVFDSASRPRFTLSACSDSLIMRFTDPVFNKFTINFGDVPPTIKDANGNFFSIGHRYMFNTDKASFKISVVGTSPPTCKSVPIEENYMLYKELPPPMADSLLMLPNGTARLFFKALQSVDYQINVEESGNILFADTSRLTTDGSTFYTFPGSLNARPQARFELKSFDACENVKTDVGLYPMFCNATSGNRQIALEWNRYQGQNFSRYVIYRNGLPMFEVGNINDTTLLDTLNLLCGVSYCYTLKAEMEVGNSGNLRKLSSIAATVCADASSDIKPPPITNAFIIPENGFMQLNWQIPLGTSPDKFTIYRANSNGAFERIAIATDTLYRDSTFMPDRANCYMIRYSDICENLSDSSATFCSIFLEVIKGNIPEKKLSWTAYTGWQDGVDRYEVEYLNAEGVPYKTVSPSAALLHVDNGRDTLQQIINYRIAALPAASALQGRKVYSNIVTVNQEVRLIFPQAFTPNNDGINDIFTGFGTHLTSYKLTIFNRWGEQIFTSNSIRQGWDGRYNNGDAPEGVYVYVASAVDETGKKIQMKGTFQLIR